MVDKSSYHRALAALSQPGGRLVVTYNKTGAYGRHFCILPSGGRVTEETARALLRRRDMHPCDVGLFPDRPQSWRRLASRSG
jgi:hypothetical protein